MLTCRSIDLTCIVQTVTETAEIYTVQTCVICVSQMLIILLYSMRMDIKIAETYIASDKITNAVKIALITDLHSCYYGKDQHTLIDKISENQPDIILLGGDIVDDERSQKNAKEFLSAIAQKYPTYYVSGNHEIYGHQIKQIKEMIKGYGITILEGDTLPITINNQLITICGVDDPEISEEVFQNQLENCANSLDENIFSVLLSHRPERIEEYNGFDLVLAGHAHGGQWRIPGIVNGLFAPNQGLFPKYAGGLYEFPNQSMIVSRGLARESTLVPRIFNRPEIVIVNLIPNK